MQRTMMNPSSNEAYSPNGKPQQKQSSHMNHPSYSSQITSDPRNQEFYNVNPPPSQYAYP